MIARAPLVLAVVLFLAALAIPRSARADEPVDSYVQLAELSDLATRPEWLRLLHVHAGAMAAESAIDDSAFFLSKRGRVDPEAELEATLEAFFEPQNPRDPDAHALCRFPARFLFLRRTLGIVPPAARCPALSEFTTKLHARSVTFVYTTNFFANPASMFGHTFMRIGKAPRAPASQGDTTLEFTADVDTKNPILYTVKGVAGLFRGIYRYARFADKMREYTASEDREMWDYDLALTDDEVEMLVDHLWELRAAKVDYFYFTGNCAYRLLEIVEAAAPRLDLLSHLKPIVFPADAVSALMTSPGLVRETRYLPSSRERLKEKYEQLPIPADKAPHLAHGPMRFDLGQGAGTQYGETFSSVGFRLALHDMNDPPNGEPELATVQFMDTRARYSETHRSFALDELTFAEVTTLHPYGRFEKVPSFRIRGFAERVHDNGCTTRDCFAHGADFAGGLTLATKNEHFAVFAMADAFFLFSPDFDGIGGSFVRAGVGPYAGIRARVAPWLLGLVEITISYLPAQHLGSTFDARASLRAGLAKNVALGFEGRADPLGIDGRIASYFYF
ncbi:MAG: DUF4105 domain-containing protein [Polyangiaceae bacterium]